MLPHLIIILLLTYQTHTQISNCQNTTTYGIELLSGISTTYQTCQACISGYYLYVSSVINGKFQNASIYQCSPCSYTCRQCSTQFSCTQCFNDMYVDTATSTCLYCYDKFSFCKDCTENSCTLCQDFTSPNSTGQCTSPCVNQFGVGCQECAPGSHCVSCVTFYGLDSNGNCQPCNSIPGCVICDRGIKCLNCQPGKGRNMTQNDYKCQPCSAFIPKCVSCNDYIQCNSCQTGYFRDFSSSTKDCLSCSTVPNCQSCIDGIQCTSCDTGYVLSVNAPGNTCNQCLSGNYIASPTSCLPCPIGCATCTNTLGTLSCQSCITPYTLNITLCSIDCRTLYGNECLTCDGNQCLSCINAHAFPASSTTCTPCTSIANCQNCIDGLVCTLCQTNFYMNLATPNKACVACSSIINCLSCKDGPQCLQCTTNYVLSAIAPGNTCVQCPPGTYYSTTVLCLNCPTGCATCIKTINGTVQCQTCTSQYKIVNGKSCQLDCTIVYGNKCSTCDLTKCLSCISGFAFPTSAPTTCTPCNTLPNCLGCVNGMVCTQCQTVMVTDLLTPNGTCVSCPITNCIKCKNGPQCSVCDINYVINATSRLNSCVTCPIGFYASSTVKCSPCPPECSSCSYSTNGIVCTSCNSIAIHNPTTQQCNRCDLFINHCNQCSSSTVCTSCIYPYKIGPSQICNECESGFFYVDGFCTKQSGCQLYLISESRCLTCFSQQNFHLDTIKKTCKCKTGFYVSNTSGITQCSPKCGDGILVPDFEVCDDGNVRNGDGCSENCLQESSFTCLSGSPSQCTLQYEPNLFEYNYAYRFEGQNKCRFSLTLQPFHPGLKYINWTNYLTFNISESQIIPNSKIFSYNERTSELTIDIEYIDSIQFMVVQFRIFYDPTSIKMVNMGRQLSQVNLLGSETPRLVSQASTPSPLVSSSKQMKVVVTIKGINSIIIHEQEIVCKLYKGACIGSWIITILILIQFIMGSYKHKMIGIETLHILQFFYFVRIILEQRLSTFLNSMNIFRFAAYGGYSDYGLIYGPEAEQVQSLTFMTVSENFVMVGLLKYFALNTNITLVIPIIALIAFLITLARKYAKRSHYMKTLEQAVKDQYTIMRRSSQWVYDHFVFPYINVFNMIVIFSTILYLQSHSTSSSRLLSSDSHLMMLIERTSFGSQIVIGFLTFFIYCFQVFQSYEEFKHSRLTEAEKARVPKSIYQKLQHDENNPDRPNYKPGYVLAYLVFYLLVQLVIMLDVLLEPLKNLGVEVMLVLTFVYFYFVWKWQPYYDAVNFHNKALRFNHFVVFFFMALSVLSKWLDLNPIFYSVLICVILTMLGVVCVFSYVRIVIEHKFRKRLLDDPNLLKNKKLRPSNSDKIDESMGRKHALLANNKFVFENQVRDWLKENQQFDIAELSAQQIEEVKVFFRKQLYESKRFHMENRNWYDAAVDLLEQKNRRRERNVEKQQPSKDLLGLHEEKIDNNKKQQGKKTQRATKTY